MKKYVLIILDGAADLSKIDEKTPLETANIPNIDYITSRGVTGLMHTLYTDLPKGSIVAQLGILGYDPYKYYPNGRASCEAKSIDIDLGQGDIAFRANLALVKNDILVSHNAYYIIAKYAKPAINLLREKMGKRFPDFELYYNSDFRNTLIVRNTNTKPSDLKCPEPHENVGKSFDFTDLIKGKNKKAQRLAEKINSFISWTREILVDKNANIVFPWSPSSPFKLPKFSILEKGKCGFITNMDFLLGIAKASGVEPFKMGNGSWDTDYIGKGKKIIDLLKSNYKLVYCHINGPDEAAHMGDFQKKVYSLEQIDKHIVFPTVKYFENYPQELGGIIVTTDHYTNTFLGDNNHRIESHTRKPVPFAVWNGIKQDKTELFSEKDVLKGKYSNNHISHLKLLDFFNLNENNS